MVGEGGEKGIMSVGDDQSHQIAPLRFKTPCISVYLIMKLLDGVLDLDSVFSETGIPLITLETVPRATPACFATSFMVAALLEVMSFPPFLFINIYPTDACGLFCVSCFHNPCILHYLYHN